MPITKVLRALFEIKTGSLVEGAFPTKAQKIITEWAQEHQADLLKDWELSQTGKPLFRIPGADQ